MANRFDGWSSTAQRNCLIWFDDVPSIHSHKLASVPNIAVYEISPSTSDSETKVQRCLTKGKIQSGQKFFVCRTFIYNDDFNHRSLLFQRGSVCGFYLQLFGLPNYRRRFLPSIMPVEITTQVVSRNLVFDFIFKNILNPSIHGVEAVDVNGDERHILL